MEKHDAFNGPETRRSRLEEEIYYMEVRLTEIGFDGDCAYERAMIKFYREQIASRRQQLDRLNV